METPMLGEPERVAVSLYLSRETAGAGAAEPNGFGITADGSLLVARAGLRVDGGDPQAADQGAVELIEKPGKGGEDPSRGELRRSLHGPNLAYLEGEAGATFGGRLYRYRRRLFFVRPERVLFVLDELDAVRPARFTWWLQSSVPLAVGAGEGDGRQVSGGGGGAGGRFHLCFVVPERLEAIITADRLELAATTTQPTRRQRFLTVLAVPAAGEAGIDWGRQLTFESEGRTLRGLGRDRLRLRLGGTELELAQGPRAATDGAWWLMRRTPGAAPEHLVAGGRYFRRAGEEPQLQERDTFCVTGEPAREETSSLEG